MKSKIWVIVAVVLISIIFILLRGNNKKNGEEFFEIIHPEVGSIERIVYTTGTIKPQNRLEIKPPIAGRIEEIMVVEGQEVKIGDVLAKLSSTERAALLDAAMLKGEEEEAYWREVYKATPLIAPIDGVIIVRSVEPGQTVTISDAIIVISDRLIIEADVDETDIGAISIGQKAIIGLDAYPDVKIKAKVDHISYESELVNNVNIYSVEIVTESIPEIFRSGMSANVEVVTAEKNNILTLPISAVKGKNGQKFVLVRDLKSGEDQEQSVRIGIKGEEQCEILSGVSQKDNVVIVKGGLFSLKNQKNGGNPFMPSRGKK